MSELQTRGYPAELFDPRNADRYGIVVYSKRYDPESTREARELQKKGARIVFDLCDNHFYNPHGLRSLSRAGKEIKVMMALADHIVASTDEMAKVMRAELAESRPLSIIGDAVETEIRGVETSSWKKWRENRRLKKFLTCLGREKVKRRTPLVWFGIHGGPNAEYGMLDLLKIRPWLEEFNQRFPLCLTVISNSQAKYQQAIRPWNFPTFYLDWHPDTFLQALQAHSIGVIPITKNPFTVCKSNHRLALSLYAGLAVVADAIPSYRVFAEACFLDDWKGGLEAYLAQPDLRQEHIRLGRTNISRDWMLDAIATQWAQLFDCLRDNRFAHP